MIVCSALVLPLSCSSPCNHEQRSLDFDHVHAIPASNATVLNCPSSSFTSCSSPGIIPNDHPLLPHSYSDLYNFDLNSDNNNNADNDYNHNDHETDDINFNINFNINFSLAMQQTNNQTKSHPINMSTNSIFHELQHVPPSHDHYSRSVDNNINSNLNSFVDLDPNDESQYDAGISIDIDDFDFDRDPTSLPSHDPQHHINNNHALAANHNGEPSEVYIGKYSRSERAAKILRYHEKRRCRVWSKKIRYTCRKSFADARPRCAGRFVKIKNIINTNDSNNHSNYSQFLTIC